MENFERAKEIINIYRESEYSSDILQAKKAIFFIGGPRTGKTTLLTHLTGKVKFYPIIDQDEGL